MRSWRSCRHSSASCTRAWAGLRSPASDSCERCCCRCSTAYAASGCSSEGRLPRGQALLPRARGHGESAGLAVNGSLTPASGFAERDQGLLMAAQLPRRATLGADKSYDTRDFVDGLRGLDVTPHLAQNTTKRSSAIDRRTTRHAGYGVSQRRRKRIEEIFGWLKTVGLLRKTRHRGVARVGWMFVFGLAVYNLVRIRNLAGEPT